MSTVNGVGNNSPIQGVIRQTIQKQVPADAPAQLPATDKVQLSGVSHLLKALQTNDVRADKVASVRSAIEAGTYEDDKKLDIAVDRMLDDILGK